MTKLRALLVSAFFVPALFGDGGGALAEDSRVSAAPLPIIKAELRAGVHDDFERLVFDWPQNVPFSLTQNGQDVQLHFSAALASTFAEPDLSTIQRRHLSSVEDYHLENRGGDLYISLHLKPDVVAKAIPQDNLLIVDFREGTAPLLAMEPLPASGKSPPATLIAAEAPSAVPPTQVPAPAQNAAPNTPEQNLPDVLTPTLGDSTVNLGTMKTAAKNDFGAPDLNDLSDQPLALLVLDPGLVTSLAVFQRADFTYLVFDKKLTLALDAMIRGTPRVKVESVDSVNGSVYRFYLPQDVSLRVEREDSSWAVLATKKVRTAPISLTISPQPEYALGARLLIPISKAGEPVRFFDPEVGDLLMVVPLPTSGQAVRQPYRYADLQFVPAEQGVVIHPRIDGVDVKRQTTGIEISAPHGLRLSPEKDTGLASTDDSNVAGGPRLFNFSEWYGPKAIPYTEMRQRWQRALAEVPQNERDRVRLDMARFYFARNHAEEAQGLINLLTQQVPDLERRSEFLALRGATRVLTHDLDATDDFKSPELATHPEIKLWQAVAKTRTQAWHEATDLFTQSDTVLENYPDPFFTDFSILAIEAAIADENRVYAANVLDRLLQRRPELDEDSQAVAYLRGVLMSLGGHLERAEVFWTRALQGKDQLYRVRAEVMLTDYNVIKGKVTPAKAAERLERLRYAWRGDDLELDILKRIGKFYIEAGKIEEGLTALKQVLAFLPENQAAADLRQEMSLVFRDVFLGDKSDKISPLDALSLYERFYELAPQGDEGDAIIRSLAERMVAVDLLDRAAGLLADQARRRLTNTFKARVGTQAAGIYLLDHKADAALDILKDTEVPNMPDDMSEERKLLQAKALALQEHYEDARKILDTSKDEYAMRLKADIAWRTRDWANVAIDLETLIGPPPQYSDPIKAEKAQLVINRAIALAMANDNPGLDKLRAGFGTVMKTTPQADLFKVLTEPENNLPRNRDSMKSFMADVDLFQDYLENYRNLK